MSTKTVTKIYLFLVFLHLLTVQLRSCNIFEGSWIFDESYPIYDSLQCPFIDQGLNCIKNGRTDNFYLKYRWQPTDCDLPRFNGEDFLKNFKGKNFMFVGDSLSNNQWQSLACMLHAAVPNSNYAFDRTRNRSVLSFPYCIGGSDMDAPTFLEDSSNIDCYEIGSTLKSQQTQKSSGRFFLICPHLGGQSYLVPVVGGRWQEFEFTITFLKDGFLVDLVIEEAGRVLKLDSLSRTEQWKGVDVLIFNSYHWWIHTGRLQTWDYFQVGDKLYKEMDHMEAYKIALTTWANWVDSNIDPVVTKAFFQGISAVHYYGKDWDEPMVKDCSGQTKPIEGSTYPGERYAREAVVKSVLSNMTMPVNLLDITLLTQLRKDGHPSRIAGGASMDCSHWCVAGVPDAWNELLYTILLQK